MTQEMKFKEEHKHIKMYCEDIGFCVGLSRMEVNVLFALAVLSYSNNEVRTGKYDREKIADLLNQGVAEGKGTTAESVRFCIGGLVKAEFLEKKATGLYILNPNCFSKTLWAKARDTRSAFELHIRYSPEKGRQAQIIHKEE